MNQRQINRLLKELGYSLARQRCHLIYTGPCGNLVVPKTASDCRSQKNLMAELRRRHPNHPALAR